MTSIEFQPLPPGKRGGTELLHHEIAAALRARPGEWALIATAAVANMTTHIKQGRTIAYRPAGSFDATARNYVKTGQRADIWARYVGENGEHK